jgi:hypothetical protein
MSRQVLIDFLFFVLFIGIGFIAGVVYEKHSPKPPPDPVLHLHKYILDRSECKKPV